MPVFELFIAITPLTRLSHHFLLRRRRRPLCRPNIFEYTFHSNLLHRLATKPDEITRQAFSSGDPYKCLENKEKPGLFQSTQRSIISSDEYLGEILKGELRSIAANGRAVKQCSAEGVAVTFRVFDQQHSLVELSLESSEGKTVPWQVEFE
jgi:hypothetical protein